MTGPHQPHPQNSGPYPQSAQHQAPLPGQQPAGGPQPGPQGAPRPQRGGSLQQPLPPNHARMGFQVMPIPDIQIPRFGSTNVFYTYGFLVVAGLCLAFAIGLLEKDDPVGPSFLIASGAFACASMVARLAGEASEIRFATNMSALIAQQRFRAELHQEQSGQ